ncbi:MAG: hypothetical protein ACR2IS_00845 [Nitrososphaeraceae archaeon]
MSTHTDNAFSVEMHESKRKRGRETKQKIFWLVEESEPKGLTLGELVEATKKVFPPKGLHRDRVGDICKEYVNRKLFSQQPKSKGKFGKYYLGPDAYGDPRLAAFVLQRKIMDPSTFFRLGKEAICFSSEYSSFHGKKGLLQSPRHKEYLESPNTNDDFDQLYLFEYSLKLGAILVYQVIQAMRHAEISPVLSSLQKDSFVLKWIENAVTPMSIVQSFRRLLPVNKRLAKPKQAENIQEGESLGWLELEKGKIVELEDIFRKAFGGSLFEDLQKSKRESLDHDILEHKYKISESERIEQLWKEDPDHVKCGGEAKPKPQGPEAFKKVGVISNSKGDTVNIYSRGQDIQPIKKCSRCGRSIRMWWIIPRKS